MENFEQIRALIGWDVTEEDLKYVDCYVHKHMGIFIPSLGECGYAAKVNHTHPSYMFIITFSKDMPYRNINIDVKENQYFGQAVSPDIPHSDEIAIGYYYTLIGSSLQSAMIYCMR